MDGGYNGMMGLLNGKSFLCDKSRILWTVVFFQDTSWRRGLGKMEPIQEGSIQGEAIP